jgi:uncharacterized repeat protein (TIGR01451 family)
MNKFLSGHRRGGGHRLRMLGAAMLVGSLALTTMTASAESTVASGPLQLTQSTSGPAVIGSTITYTLSVTNTTNTLAGGVTLGDAPPAGMKISNVLGPGGNPDLCGRTRATSFSCSMGDLAPGQTATLTFDGAVANTTSALVNSAVAQGCIGLVTPLVAGLPCANGGGSFVTTSVDLPVIPVSTPPPPVVLQVPGAPTGVTATAGNASASVAWTAPTNTGGAAIAGYTVTAFTTGAKTPAAPPLTVAAPATNATVPGLSNGTPYVFVVTASNSAGSGPGSLASNSVTPSAGVVSSAPAAPTNVQAIAGKNSAKVSWTAPAVVDPNGRKVRYVVSVATINGQPAPTQSSTIVQGSTAATVNGLTAGTSYTFVVRTLTSTAVSAPSVESNVVVP